MTSTMIKDLSKSALLKPVFLILLAIVLFLAPASAFAEGDESPASDSNSTPTDFDQDLSVNSSNSGADFSVDIPSVNPDSTGINDTPALETPAPPPPDAPSAPAETFDNSTDFECGVSTDFSGDIAGIDTGANAINTGIDSTNNTGGCDATPVYFQVAEVSMSPLLNPGAIIEVASGTYADGDMVVVQTSDGKYVVKMLDGDQLVPLGAGASYSVADVTILGAAELSSMTAESLELSGLSWSTVLAQTAIEPAGGGTSENPYLIASLGNLYWFTTQTDKFGEHYYYRQTADIDASLTRDWFETTEVVDVDGEEITIPYFKGWLPIGSSSFLFFGVYDGGGYTISNLYINRPSDDHIGLFGYTGDTAVLQNIKLEGFDITGNNFVGGLVGLNAGTISNSYAIGDVTGKTNVGGLTGKNEDGTISYSYAKSNVTGDQRVGGLVGWNQYGMISNSYAIGDVKGWEYVGGLTGRNDNTISNSYAAGSVTGAGTYVGGLVGYNNSGTISNSFYDRDTTGRSDIGKGEPKTTAEMKTLSTYVGWDIAGFDGSYPVLGWQVGESTTWYMGTPPGDTPGGGGGFGGFSGIGGFFNLGFTGVLPIQTVADLTPITGRVNVLITPGTITTGSWFDLYQASAAYQAALLFLENNGDTLSPAERALLEVELAIVKAALLAMEARLLAAEGLPYNLAALQTAYAEAMATFNANQSFLNSDQLAAANQLLAAIAGVIAALQ